MRPRTVVAVLGSIAVLEIQCARHGFIDVRDLGIRRPRRMSDVAELPARGISIESGPFLVHLDSKICSAKSNRSRHRDCEKGISDFVEKFVSHNHILPVARPNFSVIALGSSHAGCTAAAIARLGTTPLFEAA